MLSLKLPRLFTINQVPKVYHEDSIIFGYRHPRSSAKDCIISVFQLTNETLNIWTHFLPTWYFLWNLLAVLYTLDVWNDAFSWPLIVFLVSCCIYPFTSSCAHTFSTMSPRARHVCFFFDYGALSLYSLGSAISYSAYVIPDQWINSTFHRCYVPIAVFNTIVCTGLACFSRQRWSSLQSHPVLVSTNLAAHDETLLTMLWFPELERPKLSKALRTLAFAYPYMFDNIPLFYRIFLCSGEGCTDNETNALHYRHTALAFLTCFLFTTHLPERLAPGSFDFFGHSHQLFHICAVIGTHFQMKAIMMDKTLRHGWLMSHAPATTFTGTIAAVLACVTFNLCMILAFSLATCWKPDSSKKLRQEKATTTPYNQKAL